MRNLGAFIVLFCFLVEMNCVPLSRKVQFANQGDGCRQIMDIAILADRSLTMSVDDRLDLIKAVNVLVDELGVSETGNHFGFVTFAVNATLHSKFSDSFYYNASNLKSKVEEEVKFTPDISSTRTDLAMQLIEDELFTSDGGHRNNSNSVLIIITDGRPVFVNENDSRPEINTSEITTLLEKKNVSIIIIGVGQAAKSFEDEMKTKLAGKKGEVVFFKSFQRLPERIVSEFKSKFCATAPPPPAIIVTQSTKAPTEASPLFCPMDVAFILDSSNSIKDEDFNEEKEIVKKLVMDLNTTSDNRAALVLFSDSPSLEARFGQYETVYKFQEVLQKVPKMGEKTRIDRALNVAENQIFQEARQGVSKIAIILTDGVQSTEAHGLRPSSKPLRDAGVRVIAVGIGVGKQKRRLRLMTDRDEDVVDTKNIQGHLQKIFSDLIQNNCNPTPKPPIQQFEKCEDDSDYEHGCRRKTKNFCWDHPDFSFIHCKKSCELCPLS